MSFRDWRIVPRRRDPINTLPPHLAGWLSAGPLVPWRVRNAVLRLFGARIARSVEIRQGASGLGPRFEAGHDTFIHREFMVQGPGHVQIGRFVSIGPRCLLATITHDYGLPERRGGPTITRPIVIGDGCWLGAGVIVLGGVTIGSGCVIAAGAVVVRDCTPNGLYAGVPARRIRDLGGQS